MESIRWQQPPECVCQHNAGEHNIAYEHTGPEQFKRLGGGGFWTPTPLSVQLGWWLESNFVVLGVVLLAFPVTRWRLKRLRLRRAMEQNLCHNCGYDLRATPERCPECGWSGRGH